MLFAAACSSSGGGGSKPLTIGFEQSSTSSAEGTSASITLVLLSNQGPLTEDATITVQDLGSGTSVAGADHDFNADLIVTFPTGSDHGATQTINVSALADLSIEGGDETLRLVLATPSTGVSFGQQRQHILTIQDADMADLAFTAATSATVDEATAVDVEAELQLDAGESLDVDVQVTVRDERSGTATSGADYQAFQTQVLTFPSGSPDGTRLTMSFVPVGDIDPEGDETAMLVIENPSAGAQIQGAGTHEVTITDDDLSGLAFLQVTGALSGGPANTVTSGASFDLGVESLDSGPNGALELTIQNAGAQPFDLEPLQITGDTRDFSIDLQAASPLVLTMPVVFPFQFVEDDAVTGACLEMDAGLCSVLDEAENVIMDGVVLPGGGSVSLALERLDLPFTDDAVIRVDGTDVPVADAVGDLSLWSGSVPELEGSEAFLAFSSAGSHGWVNLGGQLGTVHLMTDYSQGAPEVHWLWEAQLEGAYSGELPGQCQAALVPPGVTLDNVVPDEPETQSMIVGLTLPECRLAIETDYQYWQEFNDTTAATQYATQLIAAVSAAYERDVQTMLSIAYLGIHSNPNDGWTTPDLPGTTGDMLDEFQAAWSNSFPVSADLAHFISGAHLGGGVAYVGVLCSQSFGFGVSANINGNINWGSFSGNPSNSNWDFVVVAHELGHNFGALHTHDYCPPLDQCSSNCNGSTNCPQGTLMSYCHTCGGMANLRLEFHPHVAEVMRAEVDSSCLGDATLDPGTSISVQVSFEPTSTTGSKAATLRLQHTAPNAPSPFQMSLSGVATN